MLCALLVGFGSTTAPCLSRQDIDHQSLYAQGVTFADFPRERARAAGRMARELQRRNRQRRAHHENASAPGAKRHLLVVAEDWCFDSLNTIPYIARLVDGGPERLDMRVMNRETANRSWKRI